MKHFHARRIIITTGITAILCTVTLIYTVGHIVCPLTSYANSNQNILSITPEDSTDMPLIHFDGVVSGGEWVISQDYNGMANPGHSRTTIKVDQKQVWRYNSPYLPFTISFLVLFFIKSRVKFIEIFTIELVSTKS